MNKLQKNIYEKIKGYQEDELLDDLFGFLLNNGLGSVSKREIDIYLFYLLEKYQKKNKIMLTNYEWSSFLKINETKIKNLRLEAGIRHGTDDLKVKELWFEFLDIIREGAIELTSDNKFKVTIENTFLLRYLHHIAKKKNLPSLDSSRNREIISFSKDTLQGLLETAVEETGIGKGNSIAENKIKKIKWSKYGQEAKNMITEILLKVTPKLVG